jgi:hypothetical protein
MPYIDVPIDTQPTDLAEEAFAYIEGKIPGWLPAPGNLEAILVEANAQLASELRVLVSLVPDAIFAYFGESVVGIAPYEATQATGSTRWSMIDNLGYTVEAGTLIAITPPASTDRTRSPCSTTSPCRPDRRSRSASLCKQSRLARKRPASTAPSRSSTRSTSCRASPSTRQRPAA